MDISLMGGHSQKAELQCAAGVDKTYLIWEGFPEGTCQLRSDGGRTKSAGQELKSQSQACLGNGNKFSEEGPQCGWRWEGTGGAYLTRLERVRVWMPI